MAVESEADRLEFLDTDEFGSSVKVGGETISGIMLDPYVEALGAEGAALRLVCRTSDVTTLTSVVHGTTLVIGTTSYTVRSVQPDGEGMTSLVLEEV